MLTRIHWMGSELTVSFWKDSCKKELFRISKYDQPTDMKKPLYCPPNFSIQSMYGTVERWHISRVCRSPKPTHGLVKRIFSETQVLGYILQKLVYRNIQIQH